MQPTQKTHPNFQDDLTKIQEALQKDGFTISRETLAFADPTKLTPLLLILERQDHALALAFLRCVQHEKIKKEWKQAQSQFVGHMNVLFHHRLVDHLLYDIKPSKHDETPEGYDHRYSNLFISSFRNWMWRWMCDPQKLPDELLKTLSIYLKQEHLNHSHLKDPVQLGMEVVQTIIALSPETPEELHSEKHQEKVKQATILLQALTEKGVPIDHLEMVHRLQSESSEGVVSCVAVDAIINVTPNLNDIAGLLDDLSHDIRRTIENNPRWRAFKLNNIATQPDTPHPTAKPRL